LDVPLPDEGKMLYEKIKGVKYPYSGWWGRPESLSVEFNIKPLASIMPHYHRATEDFDAVKIVLTNRLYRLKPNVIPILEKNKLFFHHHSFKYDGKSKVDRAIRIIEEHHTECEEVEFFDDMIEHVENFTEMWTKKPDIKLTIHFVFKDREWVTLKGPEDVYKLKNY
jgi:hypothetical protein